MSSITNLTIERIESRTNSVDGSEFAVAIVTGIAYAVSESGNSRFDKREVSIPLSNIKPEEANTPKVKTILNEMVADMEIYRKEVDPYEYEVPGTGEVVMLSHSWDIRSRDKVKGKENKSSIEDHVFAGSSKSTNNELEPAL
ncbi:hypothetical protein [Gracilimonas sp. BCB1]|uniref:hypothetical protein n=1 Tax=Gracilimonas sp. BCB1 TaxID=3152362 RepID=UPI0032D93638